MHKSHEPQRQQDKDLAIRGGEQKIQPKLIVRGKERNTPPKATAKAATTCNPFQLSNSMVCNVQHVTPSAHPGILFPLSSMYTHTHTHTLPSTGRESSLSIIFQGGESLIWPSFKLEIQERERLIHYPILIVQIPQHVLKVQTQRNEHPCISEHLACVASPVSL